MAIKKSDKANNNGIKCEVLEKCGVVGERGDYNLELRYVAWNDKDPRYDLRPWKIDEETGKEICGKDITLSGEELERLGKLILSMMEDDEPVEVVVED